MKPIEIKRISTNESIALQNISNKTFIETFAEANTPENMNSYINSEFSIEKLSAELINPNIEYYIASIEEEIIGYLKLNYGTAQKVLRNENCIEIERIYVSKEFLGKQVGQLLLGKAIAIAKDKKLNFVWLGVWEKNYRAIRFYEKNGFVVFDNHLFILGDDKQNDYLMKLSI